MPASATGGRIVARLSRYDLVLLCIPLAFALAALVGLVFDLPAHVATVVGSGVSALAVADALFRNPPLGT
jgi:hypothetical protein